MSVDPEFEKLVKLYYQDLYRFGFSLTRSEADACDLTQQTFYILGEQRTSAQKSSQGQRLAFTTLHREFLQMSAVGSASPMNLSAKSRGIFPHICGRLQPDRRANDARVLAELTKVPGSACALL